MDIQKQKEILTKIHNLLDEVLRETGEEVIGCDMTFFNKEDGKDMEYVWGWNAWDGGGWEKFGPFKLYAKWDWVNEEDPREK